MKAGVKTSEFLLTVLVLVGQAAATISNVLDPKWAAIAMSISTGAYAISRAFAKQGQA
jgi:hypothetical protein